MSDFRDQLWTPPKCRITSDGKKCSSPICFASTGPLDLCTTALVHPFSFPRRGCASDIRIRIDNIHIGVPIARKTACSWPYNHGSLPHTNAYRPSATKVPAKVTWMSSHRSLECECCCSRLSKEIDLDILVFCFLLCRSNGSTSETSSGFLKMSFITTDPPKARFGKCPKIPAPVLVAIAKTIRKAKDI